jgi:hypothetical protein
MTLGMSIMEKAVVANKFYRWPRLKANQCSNLKLDIGASIVEDSPLYRLLKTDFKAITEILVSLIDDMLLHSSYKIFTFDEVVYGLSLYLCTLMV